MLKKKGDAKTPNILLFNNFRLISNFQWHLLQISALLTPINSVISMKFTAILSILALDVSLSAGDVSSFAEERKKSGIFSLSLFRSIFAHLSESSSRPIPDGTFFRFLRPQLLRRITVTINCTNMIETNLHYDFMRLWRSCKSHIMHVLQRGHFTLVPDQVG